MGLFSKLFRDKEKPKQEASITISSKIDCSGDNNFPEYQGDYAKTIFLWSQRKAGTIQRANKYPQYIIYECGIADPFGYHKKLLDEGYFEKSKIQDMLASLKASELKEILKEIQLPTSGKKEALIDRIPNNLDIKIVQRYFPEESYSLSKMGKDFLAAHQDYVLLHTHKTWQINWQEYDSKHKLGSTFYDTVWGIFNERLLIETFNYGRNVYLSMSQLLEEEGKTVQALEMLLMVLYIDVSGSDIVKRIPIYRSGMFTKKELLESFDVDIMLAPGIVDAIASYKDLYSEKMIDRIYKHELPLQICSKKQFSSMIHSIIDGTFDAEQEIKKLQIEYNKFIKKL